MAPETGMVKRWGRRKPRRRMVVEPNSSFLEILKLKEDIIEEKRKP